MTMIDASARGVYPISITPFLDDGAVDFASMDRLTDFFMEIGVPGVTLLGILGEANKLSTSESLELVTRVAKRAGGRLRIIAGASQIGFDEMKAFVGAAMQAGAAGVMIAPAGNLKTEDQIIAYYDAVAAQVGATPIALQDHPQATGVYMSAATIGRIVERVPNVQIVKHEEGSGLRKLSRLRAQEKDGARRRVSILVGNSGLHLPQELGRGADGANTGVAFPEMLIAVCNRFFAGESERAEDLYDLFLPLIRHEWQMGVGLAIRKEVFRRRGLITCARTRAPGPALDADDQAELTRLLARLTRKLAQAGEDRLIASYRLPD